MRTEIFKEAIFYDLSAIAAPMLKKMTSIFFENFAGALVISVFFSLFFSADFGGLLKRSALAFVAIYTFGALSMGARDIGIEVGASMVSSENIVFQDFLDSVNLSRTGFKLAESDSQSILGSLKSLSTDFSGFIFWIISNIALWFVKVSYSLSFWVPYCLLPIMALISIFPMSSKAVDGALVAIIWNAVTPIVLGVLLELLAATLADSSGQANVSLTAKSLMSVLFALYLIASFLISKSIVQGESLSNAVANVGQSYGTGVTMMAISKMKGFGKSTFSKTFGLRKGLIAQGHRGLNNARANLYGKTMKSNKVSAEEYLDKKRNTNKLRKFGILTNPIKSTRDARDYKATAQKMVRDGRGAEPLSRINVNDFRIKKGKKPISTQTGRVIKSFKVPKPPSYSPTNSSHSKSTKLKNKSNYIRRSTGASNKSTFLSFNNKDHLLGKRKITAHYRKRPKDKIWKQSRMRTSTTNTEDKNV